MTLKELIQRAIAMAQPGLDPLARAAIEIAAEAQVLPVFGDLSEELASKPSTRHLLARIKTVNVVNGSVALPDDVLTAYACEAQLFDPDEPDTVFSRTDWADFLSQQLDDRLGHFLINEGTLFVVDPGDQYVHGIGPTRELRLIIPCTLEVPALNNQIAAPAEILDMLLERLAASLRAGFTK